MGQFLLGAAGHQASTELGPARLVRLDGPADHFGFFRALSQVLVHFCPVS
jgi:hypothetical protein